MPSVAQLLASGNTAAVILGASDWTRAGLANAPSFRRSAKALMAWLIDSKGLNLDPDLVLDYFDSRDSASEQLDRLGEDLEARLRGEDRTVSDLLVYYIGHGFPDDAGSLSLLVRQSRSGAELSTGIRVRDLAAILKVSAPKQRRLTVFDCCFSERAVASFVGMGVRGEAIARSVSRDIGAALPSRGGLFLGASPRDREAIGKPDAAGTLFTTAFLEIVRHGIEGGGPTFSFRDLADAAYNVALAEHGSDAPRPVLHPVNQQHGDLSGLPAFRNAAHRSESTPASARSRSPGPARPIDAASPRPVLEGAAAKGDANAAYWLAKAILAGAVLDEESVDQAWDHLCAAADRGHADALFALGEFCELGEHDTEINETEAVRRYEEAADRGSVAAQIKLAEAYDYGWLGLENDEDQAFRYYSLAASCDDIEGLIGLARCYEFGSGTEIDKDKAVETYERAARLGSGNAALSLGLLWAGQKYRLLDSIHLGTMVPALSTNPIEHTKKALAAFKTAADLGDLTAKLHLALCTERGWGVTADPRAARRMLEQLADQGLKRARVQLAHYYEHGIGGLKADLVEARRLFEASLNGAGLPIGAAHLALGRYFEFGLGGLDVDRAQAIHHYEMVSYSRDAKTALTRLGVPGYTTPPYWLSPDLPGIVIDLHGKPWWQSPKK